MAMIHAHGSLFFFAAILLIASLLASFDRS
jgi:hypothetical protein